LPETPASVAHVTMSLCLSIVKLSSWTVHFDKEENDTGIGKANGGLRELCCSVITKRELSNAAKLSIFKIGLYSDPHLWT